MLTKRVFLLGALLLVALVAGIFKLLVLRVDHGDVYVPYSSLRADPVGCKALLVALDKMPGLNVTRNYRPTVRMRPLPDSALLYLGTPRFAVWEADELAHVQDMIQKDGMRVVIGFLPGDQKYSPDEEDKDKDGKKGGKEGEQKKKDGSEKRKKKKKAEDKEEQDKDEKSYVSFNEVGERLGFSFASGKRDGAEAVRRGDGPLEARIPCHTGLRFAIKDSAWQSVYEVDGKPVVMTRAYGKGSIVLIADSYVLSNEALRDDLRPGLLAWIVGPAKNVVFDEESHGVREQDNIAILARRYGLQGCAAALLLLVTLFIWRSACPLMPPLEEQEKSDSVVVGKRVEEGFVNLLRRSLAPGELAAVCASEWRKAFDPRERRVPAGQLENLLDNSDGVIKKHRSSLESYRRIYKYLAALRADRSR